MDLKDFKQQLVETGHNFDWQLFEKVVKFATLAKGEEGLDHNFVLAEKLVELKVVDSKTIAAAILHDVTDLGAANFSDLEREFGSEIANLVKNVAELKVIKFGTGQTEQFAENLRKMFLVMAKDLRVILIKLADIFDNLKNPRSLDSETKKNLAKETLAIFAPLAGRLGIGELKGELEDLAFPVSDPQNFEWLTKFSKKSFAETDKMFLRIKGELITKLRETGILAQIDGRKKHIYSLYKKLLRTELGKDISKVYDLVALRIVVESIEDCYKVLGIVHKLWRPLPDYVRDYIAQPKSNGYQSLHTTVFGPANRPFEIQIRTRGMHEIAEFGIAASWHYSEQKARRAKDAQVQTGFVLTGEKLNWLRQLRDWQKEVGKSSEFLQGLKFDIFADRVFVFTPKGDVKDLPVGATPVDFAYSVHTKLGANCAGCKVDGKLVPLDYQLKTGQVVVVIEDKTGKHKPSAHWLDFVKTNLAKSNIKKILRGESFGKN